ncbi:cornifelin homolog A-like [Hemiscyllium ocellatum]|uniref:cornifelin homolog A-like n=1 Tax=Hemiscyllium ocellatum TaxID=170820 RepID=UPI0029666ACA|nr:cornifelin homolog A-like [Hemiscyllium ocellatum]
MSLPGVITQQPITERNPLIGTGSWRSGLCDLADNIPVCVLGALCPQILSCHLAHSYGENCCLPLVPGGMIALRTHMRLSYNIEGTICDDAVMLLFCGPCEICRMTRELRTRNG